MAQEFARQFYSSQAWDRCRKAYSKSVGCLCEECLRKGLYNPGEVVHHIIKLTPENIHDNHITLGWGNLEMLCRNCHAEKHGKREKRYKVDAVGRVVCT